MIVRWGLRRIAKGLRGVAGYALHGYPLRFDDGKKALIDEACSLLAPPPTSFADLGGVWRIEGAYSFYMLKQKGFQRGVLVDTNMTETVHRKQRANPRLVLIQGDFGSADVAAKIGRVDVILLFDVLLHQVNPNWDEILELYASHTRCFVIYNQQLITGSATIRLPDLGKEKYFEFVPMDEESPGYKALFERPDELHPVYRKPYRDVHNVWQWGITDADLLRVMQRLGFRVVVHRNFGMFSKFTHFENHGFVFVRNDA